MPNVTGTLGLVGHWLLAGLQGKTRPTLSMCSVGRVLFLGPAGRYLATQFNACDATAGSAGGCAASGSGHARYSRSCARI